MWNTNILPEDLIMPTSLNNRYDTAEKFVTAIINQVPFYWLLSITNNNITHLKLKHLLKRYTRSRKFGTLPALEDFFRLCIILSETLNIDFIKIISGTTPYNMYVMGHGGFSDTTNLAECAAILFLRYGYSKEQWLQLYALIKICSNPAKIITTDSNSEYNKQMNLAAEMYSKYLTEKINGPILEKPHFNGVDYWAKIMDTEGIYDFSNISLTKALLDIYDSLGYISKWHSETKILDTINNTSNAESKDVIEGIRALNNALYQLIVNSTRHMSDKEIENYLLPIKEYTHKLANYISIEDK